MNLVNTSKCLIIHKRLAEVSTLSAPILFSVREEVCGDKEQDGSDEQEGSKPHEGMAHGGQEWEACPQGFREGSADHAEANEAEKPEDEENTAQVAVM